MLKSILSLFPAVLVVLATAAFAGEDAWYHEVDPISGNWHITVNPGDEGEQSGTLGIRPKTTTVCIPVDGGGCLFRLRHEVSAERSVVIRDGDTSFGDIIGHSSITVTQLSPTQVHLRRGSGVHSWTVELAGQGDGNFRGNWEGHGASGTETWQFLPPEIHAIGASLSTDPIFVGAPQAAYSPDRTLTVRLNPYDTYNWSGSRDDTRNRPQFRVFVYGANLEGPQDIYFPDAVDYEVFHQGRLLSVAEGDAPRRQVGVYFDTRLWPKAEPGELRLRVNDRDLRVSVVIPDHPGPAPTPEPQFELSVLRRDGFLIADTPLSLPRPASDPATLFDIQAVQVAGDPPASVRLEVSATGDFELVPGQTPCRPISPRSCVVEVPGHLLPLALSLHMTGPKRPPDTLPSGFKVDPRVTATLSYTVDGAGLKQAAQAEDAVPMAWCSEAFSRSVHDVSRRNGDLAKALATALDRVSGPLSDLPGHWLMPTPTKASDERLRQLYGTTTAAIVKETAPIVVSRGVMPAFDAPPFRSGGTGAEAFPIENISGRIRTADTFDCGGDSEQAIVLLRRAVEISSGIAERNREIMHMADTLSTYWRNRVNVSQKLMDEVRLFAGANDVDVPLETTNALKGWGFSFLLNVLDEWVLKNPTSSSGPSKGLNIYQAWAVTVQAGEALQDLITLEEVKAEGQEMLGWMEIAAYAEGTWSRTDALARVASRLHDIMQQSRHDYCICASR